jgi:hypothetical protein
MYRYSLMADEQFFQTALMNSALRHMVLSDSMHYVDWTVDPGPRVFGLDDFAALAQSGKLFARKFDTESDATILDRIDAELIGAG